MSYTVLRFPAKEIDSVSLSTEQFLIGSSLLEHWPDAVDQCVEEIGGQSSNENLGFIYTTDSHALSLIHI